MDKPQTIDINAGFYFQAILKNRWLFIRNGLLTVLLIALGTFLLPSKYSAYTTILPSNTNEHGGILQELITTTKPDFNLSNRATTPSLLHHMLNSRTLNQEVLATPLTALKDSSTLQDYWGYQSTERALKELARYRRITLNSDGILKIEIEMDTPELAAEIANIFAAKLDQINQQHAVEKGRQSLTFLGQQKEEIRVSLDSAMKKLADFQKKNKTIALDTQTRVAVEQLSDLKARIISCEVELALARSSRNKNHASIKTLEKKLSELKKHVKKIEFSSSEDAEATDSFLLPISTIPNLSRQYAILAAEVNIQKNVYTWLMQRHYQVQLETASNVSTLQILDVATPPEYPSKPRRGFLIGIGFLLAVFFTLLQVVNSALGDSNHSPFWKAALADTLKSDQEKFKRLFRLTKKGR